MERLIPRRPEKDLRDFFDGSLAYLIAMGLLLVGSLTMKLLKPPFELSAIFVELAAIALPAVLFAKKRGRKPLVFLRINPLKPIDGLIVIGVFLTAYPVGVFLNYLVIMGLTRLGKVIPPNIPVPDSTGAFILQIVSIAGSAALCEELMFRGFILRAYEGLGWKKALFISAGLFSALHLSLQNMAATFYLGLLLGFVVYKTNSIFAGMLGHFLNNTIAVMLNAAVRNIPGAVPEKVDGLGTVMPTTEQFLIGAIFLGVFAVFMLAAQTGLLFILHERALTVNKIKEVHGPKEEVRATGWKEIWPLVPAAIVVAIFVTLEILNLLYDHSIKLFT